MKFGGIARERWIKIVNPQRLPEITIYGPIPLVEDLRMALRMALTIRWPLRSL